ncbi:MAG TPA: hypothetical protein VM818_18975 [Vicinamibacterales bacterium]|jgi:hypothetical protein|nr:hypothetical protein [Vicinamibacterales bacterium]
MIRARSLFAATLVGVSFASGVLSAQAPAPAPKFTPILAGKQFTAPVRGKVDVEFTKPVTKREKDLVVTTLDVKNISDGPIARLTVEEIWYDKGGEVIGGGRGAINGVLPAGKVQTIEIKTPYNSRFNANNYKFTHANGSVEPKRVDKMVDPDAEAKAAEKKAAAAKK